MAAVALLILGAIVVGLVFAIRKFMDNKDDVGSDGGDVIPYLLLALAVGTAGFSLAALARTAFPAESFVLELLLQPWPVWS